MISTESELQSYPRLLANRRTSRSSWHTEFVPHGSRDLRSDARGARLVVERLLGRRLHHRVGWSPKAAGKSTFLAHALAAVLTGTSTIGRTTQRTSVVYLTEERPETFRLLLARAGLTECDDLHVKCWHEISGMTMSASRSSAAIRTAPDIAMINAAASPNTQTVSPRRDDAAHGRRVASNCYAAIQVRNCSFVSSQT